MDVEPELIDRQSIQMGGSKHKRAGVIGKSTGPRSQCDGFEDSSIRAIGSNGAGLGIGATWHARHRAECRTKCAAQHVAGFAGRKENGAGSAKMQAQPGKIHTASAARSEAIPASSKPISRSTSS